MGRHQVGKAPALLPPGVSHHTAPLLQPSGPGEHSRWGPGRHLEGRSGRPRQGGVSSRPRLSGPTWGKLGVLSPGVPGSSLGHWFPLIMGRHSQSRIKMCVSKCMPRFLRLPSSPAGGFRDGEPPGRADPCPAPAPSAPRGPRHLHLY